MTLIITGLSAGLALVLAWAVLRCQISARPYLRWAGFVYVIVFRNLPLVPLLLLLTFAVPHLWFWCWHHTFPRGLELYVVVFGLALNTAGYLSEILRAGVNSVPTEQMGAAKTLGLSAALVRRRVIYPQAIRITAPALNTRLIHNMKNSTLALVVPLPLDRMELAGQASRIAGQTFSWAEPLIFVASVHLGLAVGCGWALGRWAAKEQRKIEAKS
jgi:ABC-type amino acid transport system permease subunit